MKKDLNEGQIQGMDEGPSQGINKRVHLIG